MSLTGVCGAVVAVVSLIDGWRIGPILCLPGRGLRMGKDKSRIMRPRRPGCGTTATGEIFRFHGGFCIRSLASRTWLKPALIWYWMSCSKSSITSGISADGCGPRSRASRIWSGCQSGPQSTSTPCSHHLSSGPNGCASIANGDGCIKLRYEDSPAEVPIGVSCIKTRATDGLPGCWARLRKCEITLWLPMIGFFVTGKWALDGDGFGARAV